MLTIVGNAMSAKNLTGTFIADPRLTATRDQISIILWKQKVCTKQLHKLNMNTEQSSKTQGCSQGVGSEGPNPSNRMLPRSAKNE